MPRVLDIEQSLLLLELEPPFDKRDVQLARRRMAKRWHPDIAPAGRQFEHERHLKAINEAADQLERLAETSRGGKVSRNAVKVSAAAARQAREEAGRRAYEAEQRAREQAVDRAKNDPFGARPRFHLEIRDRFWKWIYFPVAWATEFASRQIGRIQVGSISIYLLYSFLTIIFLLVFVR